MSRGSTTVSHVDAPVSSAPAPTEPIQLSHLNEHGDAHMVDISMKEKTHRTALARATLYFSNANTYQALYHQNSPKGDVLAVARIAAIQAAKRTSDLIPLAHPGLGLTGVKIRLNPFAPDTSGSSSGTDTTASARNKHRKGDGGIHVYATVSCHGKTGVEMEALTSATVGALTLYDMLKGVDKSMRIDHCRVVSKTGGKSGDWSTAKDTKSIVYTSGPNATPSAACEASIPSTEEIDFTGLGHDPSYETNSATEENDHADLKTQSRSKAQNQPGGTAQSAQVRNENGVEIKSTPAEFDASSSPASPNSEDGSAPLSTRPAEEVRFDRAARDSMSGRYADRVDHAAFMTRSIERYQDWAKVR